MRALIYRWKSVNLFALAAEDMTSPNAKEGMQASGGNSILPKEHGSKFFSLPVVKNSDKDVRFSVLFFTDFHGFGIAWKECNLWRHFNGLQMRSRFSSLATVTSILLRYSKAQSLSDRLSMWLMVAPEKCPNLWPLDYQADWDMTEHSVPGLDWRAFGSA